MLGTSDVGVVTAFVAGVVSFLSPCVLPLVPGYVSYVAGQSIDDLAHAAAWRARLPVIWLSSVFVLGFSTVFVALGASATAIGQLLLDYRYETNLLGGGIIILFGLFMIGVLRISSLDRDFRFVSNVPGGHAAGAFVLGLAFAFGWTPCIGPVLGAILTMSAWSGTVAYGASLLAVYSLGLGLPFVLTAAFTGAFLRRARNVQRFGRPLQIAAGLIMVIMGIAVATGKMAWMAIWFLQTFPVLQRIG